MANKINDGVAFSIARLEGKIEENKRQWRALPRKGSFSGFHISSNIERLQDQLDAILKAREEQP